MPMLVHIASERPSARSAAPASVPGKYRDGVYAMPVLKNFMVSHQWLRELKRGGGRTLRAVHSHSDGETVLMGPYGREQVQLTAAQAAPAIMHAEDPLGMQIIVPRAIAPKEIHAIRNVPQVVGWRHLPGVHARRPCGCPYCQSRGAIKSPKLREEFEAG